MTFEKFHRLTNSALTISIGLIRKDELSNFEMIEATSAHFDVGHALRGSNLNHQQLFIIKSYHKTFVLGVECKGD